MIDLIDFDKVDGGTVTIATQHIVCFENASTDDFETWFVRLTLSTGQTIDVKGDADKVFCDILEKPWKQEEQLDSIIENIGNVASAIEGLQSYLSNFL